MFWKAQPWDKKIHSLHWLICPGQHALKWILSSRRVYPFSGGVSAQILGYICASSACAIAAVPGMIDGAFHWLTPTQTACISLWAGISSDTQVLCLPPKSGVLLPFERYFWMIFSFMLLYLLQLNSYTQIYWGFLQPGSQARGSAASNQLWRDTASLHFSHPVPASTRWGGNHILCVFCTKWFVQIDKTQP